MKNFDYVIIDLVESAARNMRALPLNLGGLSGPGGGIGGPPGGFIGWLPQSRVAYDDDEIASSGITGSGTLIDNLNHIRYRLNALESGILIVDDWDGIPTINNVNHITFSGGVIVTEISPGHALVTVTASGGGSALTVEQLGGISSISNVDKIIFSGATVTDLGSGDVLVAISGGGGNSFIAHEDFSPTISGITHYDTFHVIQSGSLEVYYNGIRQEPIQHYLEDSDGFGFTIMFSPETSGVLLADYITPTSGFPIPSAGTTIIYSGIGVGHTIQDEGIDLTQRDNLNFVGAGVEVTDDAGNNASKITILDTHYFPFNSLAGYYLSVTGIPWFGTIDRDITFIRWSQTFYVYATNDVSNYWTIGLYKGGVELTDETLIASFNTSSYSVADYHRVEVTSFSPTGVTTSDMLLFIRCTKVNSPGAIRMVGSALLVK